MFYPVPLGIFLGYIMFGKTYAYFRIIFHMLHLWTTVILYEHDIKVQGDIKWGLYRKNSSLVDGWIHYVLLNSLVNNLLE